MSRHTTRRRFLKHIGLHAAALPFICNLPSLGFASSSGRKQRLVILFSPNGVIPWELWPDEEGPLTAFKEILAPLEPFRDRTLTLQGVCDQVRGDGDNHMRGIGCLLTGRELFPGNIQGGSDTPAGWSSGHSIDQEIRNFLQQDERTRTRFGSLEFGVNVPDRADTWTRMCYRGPNQPITPVSNPYQMFNKLYGDLKDREHLASVLDDLTEDLRKIERMVSQEDRKVLSHHADFVRQLEQELKSPDSGAAAHAMPQLEPGIVDDNDNMPQVSRMQIELLVNSFAADFTRVASLQYTYSVGNARMKWLGIEDNHHSLSHEPDSNKEAVEKLVKINKWYCEQVAYLAQRLAETPEPGGEGSLLDNTTIVWTNELGKGNSHTLNDIPFVLVGGGLGFQMGRSLKFKKAHHNRLLVSLAQGMGHTLESFGNPDYCAGGPLSGLV